MTNAFASSQVEELLKKCNLSEYYERFIVEGFDELRSLLEVTEADLIAMDVKRGHRRRLQREIATLKGIPQNLPLYMAPGPLMKDSICGLSNESPLQNNRPNVIYVNSANQNDISTRHSQPPQNHTSKEDDSLDSNGQQDNANGKRKYRRHPKRDKNAPVKPPSAYVMFANQIREKYQGHNISFPEMAKIVGDQWKTIAPQEKEAIKAEAAKAKEKYRAELEAYKATDQWKQHQEYLKDFKDKFQVSQFRGDNACNDQRKRSKIEPSPETDNGGHSGYSSGRSMSLGYQSSGSNSSVNNENNHSQGSTYPHGISPVGSYSPNSDLITQNFHRVGHHIPSYSIPTFDFNGSSASSVADKDNPHLLSSAGTSSTGTPLIDLCGRDSDEQSSTSAQKSRNNNKFDAPSISTKNSSATTSSDDTASAKVPSSR